MGLEMFFGEIFALFSLALPILSNSKKAHSYFMYFKSEHNNSNNKSIPGFLIVGLGGILDSLASCLEILAILIFPSTYYALMKNGSILFTAIFSILILKKKLYRHHWLGILIIFLGFSIITFSNFLNEFQRETKKVNSSIYLGVFLMVLSLIFSSMQFVYQEFLLKKYALDVKRIVGNEGIFGALILTLVLIGTSLTPCMDNDMCSEGKPFDSPGQAITFIFNNPKVFVAGVIAVSSVMIFNISGVALTKMVSAIFRRMIDSLRTILIWIIMWMFGLDQIGMWNVIIEIIGLSLLLIGNLVYNEIIEMNILGFNRFFSQRILTDLA